MVNAWHYAWHVQWYCAGHVRWHVQWHVQWHVHVLCMASSDEGGAEGGAELRAHRTSPQTLFLVTSLYFCRAEASETRCAGAIAIQALQSPGLPVG